MAAALRAARRGGGAAGRAALAELATPHPRPPAPAAAGAAAFRPRQFASQPLPPSVPGPYVEAPHVDPTHGRAKWHRMDPSQWRERNPEKPVLGAINSQEYDEKHGRWWFTYKERLQPKLYTTIGRHARSPRLKRTTVRWAHRSPNLRRLRRDPYRKRWPKLQQFCIRFFAEFCNKDFKMRTLLETAHRLPLYGVGCKFWRGKTEDAAERFGKYFVVTSAEYRQRPIRGVLRGTQYLFGRPVRHGVAAVAKSLGSWRHEPPAGAHPAVHRPPFPTLLAERGAAGEASAEE